MNIVSDLLKNPIFGTYEIACSQEEDEKQGSYKVSPQKCTDEGLTEFNEFYGPGCF
jgi:hypothetical protein